MVGSTRECGVMFKEGAVDRLLAYARAVSHFPTAVKEFEWRNGEEEQEQEHKKNTTVFRWRKRRRRRRRKYCIHCVVYLFPE